MLRSYRHARRLRRVARLLIELEGQARRSRPPKRRARRILVGGA